MRGQDAGRGVKIPIVETIDRDGVNLTALSDRRFSETLPRQIDHRLKSIDADE